MKRKDYKNDTEFMNYLWDVYSQWRTSDFIEDKIENMTNRELKDEYEAFLEMKKESEDDREEEIKDDIEHFYDTITSFNLLNLYEFYKMTTKQRQAYIKKRMNSQINRLSEYTKEEVKRIKTELLKRIEKVK